ncbi:MAG: hypothetical protein LC737_05225, partial [Chloroflexi bacterium]|nr:hypothetical protein [Chloroflexota bacterium]
VQASLNPAPADLEDAQVAAVSAIHQRPLTILDDAYRLRPATYTTTRLEKDLDSLSRRQAMEQSLLDVVQLFNDNVTTARDELMKNPLRFNTFVRWFFSQVTLASETERASAARRTERRDDRRGVSTCSYADDRA